MRLSGGEKVLPSLPLGVAPRQIPSIFLRTRSIVQGLLAMTSEKYAYVDVVDTSLNPHSSSNAPNSPAENCFPSVERIIIMERAAAGRGPSAVSASSISWR